MDILTLNCASSSIHYELFNREAGTVIAKGIVERVGVGDSYIIHTVPGREVYHENYECPDYVIAVQRILRLLTSENYGGVSSIDQIAAVAHRIVHGGEKFNRSVLVDSDVLDSIRAVKHLAPLHAPANIAGVEAAQEVLPDSAHVAIFDTAFHQTMPDYAYTYALPYQWYEDYGVRRYGFHGTSHLYVSKRAAALLGKKAVDCNLITLHLGNAGVSHCAIKNGVSVDTSMGMTPLEGAVMGTRCGDIDPAIPIFIQQQEQLSAAEVDMLLNKKSGVYGITGKYTDRRDILDGIKAGDERCKLAFEVECYRIRKYIGAYYAVVGKPDAIVFTATMGELNPELREEVLEGLNGMGVILDRVANEQAKTRRRETLISTADSPVRAYVIPTNEEQVFIEDVIGILEGTYTDHLHFNYSFGDSSFTRS
jgi:acetate kinase